jgi:spore coat polysaccharide biosynthesis protein SpsF (cytidylyltransferase family)
MNAGAIITARSDSSRFPNKILENITCKYKSIDILILRAKCVSDNVILATTNQNTDNELINYVENKYSIKIFRGSKDNKLKRWYDCLKKYDLNFGCFIDGDDLAFDYNLYKDGLNLIKNDNLEIVELDKKIITGLFTYVISLEGLRKMSKYFLKKNDTEIIAPFILKAQLKSNILPIDSKIKNKNIRLTFDYKEDLYLFKKIYDHFSVIDNSNLIVDYLIKNPNLAKINYFREIDWATNHKRKLIDEAIL